MSENGKNLPSIAGNSGGSVSKKDLKAALSLLEDHIANDTDGGTEKIQDAIDRLERTARTLFVIARALKEVVNERQ
jgi:hypothetical protein